MSEIDPLYDDAVTLAKTKSTIAPAQLQRYFLIGYNRAARLLEAMERDRIISPSDNGSYKIIGAGDE